MMPDIRSIKRDLQELVDRRIRAESHRKLGALALSPIHIIHEGRRMKTIRADGSSDYSDLKSASGEITIPLNKVGKLSDEERLDLLNKVTDEMARQMAMHLYGLLDEILEANGQVIQSEETSTVEKIFAAFEKVQIDFDNNGNIKNFVISAGSGAVDALRRAEDEIRSDPVLIQRWEALIDRKREDWRAREATRKLVG